MRRSIFLLALTVASCRQDFYASQQLYGCYADGSNHLQLLEESVIVNGDEFSYDLVQAKMGTGLLVDATFESRNGVLEPQPGNDYFYQFTDEGEGLHVIIPDQNAYIFKLYRGECT